MHCAATVAKGRPHHQPCQASWPCAVLQKKAWRKTAAPAAGLHGSHGVQPPRSHPGHGACLRLAAWSTTSLGTPDNTQVQGASNAPHTPVHLAASLDAGSGWNTSAARGGSHAPQWQCAARPAANSSCWAIARGPAGCSAHAQRSSARQYVPYAAGGRSRRLANAARARSSSAEVAATAKPRWAHSSARQQAPYRAAARMRALPAHTLPPQCQSCRMQACEALPACARGGLEGLSLTG